MSSNQTTAARPRPLEGAQPHASRNSRRDGRAVGRPFTVSTPMTTPPDPAGDSPPMTNEQILTNLGACSEAVKWASKYRTPKAAWKACERGDWMLWYAGRRAGPVGDPRRRRLMGAAAACARLALPIWQKHNPKDERVEKCLDACDDYAKGSVNDAQLAAAGAAAWAAARAAARAAAVDAAWAAARAAAGDAAGDAAWDAAWAAAGAAAGAAARDATLKRCADLDREHYPEVPR